MLLIIPFNTIKEKKLYLKYNKIIFVILDIQL